MLVASRMPRPFARDVFQGLPEQYAEFAFLKKLAAINPDDYAGKRLVIKGCSGKPVPPSAYLEITRRLQPVAASIMFGEPCSYGAGVQTPITGSEYSLNYPISDFLKQLFSLILTNRCLSTSSSTSSSLLVWALPGSFFLSFKGNDGAGLSSPDPASVRSINLNKDFDFCGEKLPMDNFDVRQRLDAELLRNVYYHSATILSIKRANALFPRSLSRS
jgi:hypothetical protein